MTPDELEARSKSELIDLILKQQSHIADLQAQLVQAQGATRPNGSEAELVGARPMGRFPGALKIVVAAAGVFACAVLALIATFRPGAQVSVGRAGDFAPGSVMALQLPPAHRGEPSIAVLIVNDPAAGILALHGRDPSSNCLLSWEPTARRIEDPCSGAAYTQTGDYLTGPSPRNLDRFAVIVDGDEVIVDVSRVQSGAGGR